MKANFDKFIASIPYWILIIFVGSLLIFLYEHGITYEHFTGVVGIIIWPTVVLIAILFFKKVFTYLFLSMEEYNFFGNKGRLKDVREVIDKMVERRIGEEREREKTKAEFDRFASEIDSTKKSRDSSEKKADEYLKLANEILASFKDLSKTHQGVLKELDELRQREAEREARKAKIREMMKRQHATESGIIDEGSDVPKADKSSEQKTESPVVPKLD